MKQDAPKPPIYRMTITCLMLLHFIICFKDDLDNSPNLHVEWPDFMEKLILSSLSNPDSKWLGSLSSFEFTREHTIFYLLFCFVLSIFSFISIFQGVQYLTGGSKRGRIRGNLFFIFMTSLFISYRYAAGTGLDFAIITENFFSGWSVEALSVIMGSFSFPPLLLGMCIIVIFAMLQKKSTVLTGDIPVARRKIKSTIAVFLFICMAAIPVPSYDPWTSFSKTVYHYYQARSYEAHHGSGYPFTKTDFKPSTTYYHHHDSPTVFLVMIESFNSVFVRASDDRGREYTPFFNKLIDSGVYVKDFYGTSIQTARGHLSTLYGIWPSFSTMVYRRKHDIKLYGLPNILKEKGYQNHFFQAYSDSDFDNTFSFLLSHGFDRAETVEPYLKPEDKPFNWGWGVEDAVFYKRFFDYVDHQHDLNPDQPKFFALATINNHMNFDFALKEREFLFPGTNRWKERYANSIYLVDMGIQAFMAEYQKRPYLKNSIVIFTGDHSYPSGEHGITKSEVGFYNDSFKVPFLLLWDDIIPPEQIRDIPYSQVDIAPTLIDLLGISLSRHHFQGRSIFDKTLSERPLFLIQPYNGIYLSVVRNQMKYSIRLRNHEEYLFDLKTDPKENENIIGHPEYRVITEQFRKDIQSLIVHQSAIAHNRFWP